VDISVTNREAKPIVVHYIGGAFQDIATMKPVLNVFNSCSSLAMLKAF